MVSLSNTFSIYFGYSVAVSHSVLSLCMFQLNYASHSRIIYSIIIIMAFLRALVHYLPNASSSFACFLFFFFPVCSFFWAVGLCELLNTGQPFAVPIARLPAVAAS